MAAAVALTGGSSSSTTTPTPLPDSGTAVSLAQDPQVQKAYLGTH